MARCESESDFSGDEIECFHSDIAEDESEDDGNLYYGVSGPEPYKFEPLASARKRPISCTSGRTDCQLREDGNLPWSRRAKARLILIFSTNTDRESVASRSF